MKKTLSLALALLLALAAGTAMAQEDTLRDGVAQSRARPHRHSPRLPAAALAPFSVRAGDVLCAGQTVFSVEPQRVYAPMDGTVADVYVEAGGSADAAMDRYGAFLRIEYADRYQIGATNRTGYNSVKSRPARGHARLSALRQRKHFADDCITAVSGSQFTVEVLGGDLVFTEDVKIYRDPEYANKTLLARASLSAVPPYDVTASGTVTDLAVRPGDSVKAGDYLFSYVPDALDPLLSTLCVQASQALIVTEVNVQPGASVQKDQALLTAVPFGSYRLRAEAAEGDVGRIAVGEMMTVRFEELDLPAAQAVVTAVGALGDRRREPLRRLAGL